MTAQTIQQNLEASQVTMEEIQMLMRGVETEKMQAIASVKKPERRHNRHERRLHCKKWPHAERRVRGERRIYATSN